MPVADLAQGIGASPALVSSYQVGRRVPTDVVVEALARELDYPVTFFYGSEVDDLRDDAVSFRSLSRLRARDRDAALAAAQIARLMADWMEAHYELPAAAVPEHPGIPPEEAADAVRSAWGLGQGPIANMVHLLEAHGLRVFSLQEDCAEMDAFCFWDGPTPFVFLNAFKTGERSRFDAAHELGHLVLHRHDVIARSKEAEREANEFASALLMPRGAFEAGMDYRTINLSALLKVKEAWSVSIAAATFRMKRLGLIGEWDYRSLFQQLSARGWRTSEPNPMQREQSRVIEFILDDLRSEGRSLRDVAAEIGVPLAELRAFTFGLSTAPQQPHVASIPGAPLGGGHGRHLELVKTEADDAGAQPET